MILRIYLYILNSVTQFPSGKEIKFIYAMLLYAIKCDSLKLTKQQTSNSHNRGYIWMPLNRLFCLNISKTVSSTHSSYNYFSSIFRGKKFVIQIDWKWHHLQNNSNQQQIKWLISNWLIDTYTHSDVTFVTRYYAQWTSKHYDAKLEKLTFEIKETLQHGYWVYMNC